MSVPGAKERIMEAAIDLIEKRRGDILSITVRDIATQAGVGTGLINYHFQTKENLLDQCVQRMISRVIGQFEPLYRSLKGDPVDKLRFLAKSTSKFMADHPGISRISVLTDLATPRSGDNSTESSEAYRPVVQEIYSSGRTDKEVSVLLHILVASIQVAFLRKDVIKQTLGLDFDDEAQRGQLIDMIIDRLC